MKDKERKASTDNHDTLKPSDVKDIEELDNYGNQVTKFKTWSDKCKDLLTSRSGSWEKLLGLIENRGKVTIKSHKEFMNSLDDANCMSIKEQWEIYDEKLVDNSHRWRPQARAIQTD